MSVEDRRLRIYACEAKVALISRQAATRGRVVVAACVMRGGRSGDEGESGIGGDRQCREGPGGGDDDACLSVSLPRRSTVCRVDRRSTVNARLTFSVLLCDQIARTRPLRSLRQASQPATPTSVAPSDRVCRTSRHSRYGSGPLTHHFLSVFRCILLGENSNLYIFLRNWVIGYAMRALREFQVAVKRIPRDVGVTPSCAQEIVKVRSGLVVLVKCVRF